MTNDVALIRLNTECIPGIEDEIYKRRVQLPTKQLETSSECYILGYGYTQYNGQPSCDLQIANLNYITLDECIEKLGRVGAPERHWGMFCAKGHNGVDACNVCFYFE